MSCGLLFSVYWSFGSSGLVLFRIGWVWFGERGLRVFGARKVLMKWSNGGRFLVRDDKKKGALRRLRAGGVTV